MKLKNISTILLSAILLTTGCAKEDNAPQLPGGSDAIISLDIPTRANGITDPEFSVGTVRIASFVPAGAASAAGLLDVNSLVTLEAGKYTATLHTGSRELYVFVNEGQSAGMTTKLNAIRSLADLASIQIPYDAAMTAPFFCAYNTTVEIEKEGNATVTAATARTVSKLVLTIKYEWGTGKPLSEEIVLDRVQVLNVPEFSYLIGKDYYGETFTSSREVATTTELANQSTTPLSSYLSKPLTIYIPEFLGATDAADDHAYLEIVGHLKSNPAITSTYRMPLGNAMDGNGTITGSNYDITRNTAFTINATIKSFGELNQIEIHASVVDWNKVNSTPEDVGEYLIVAETTKPLKFTIKEDITIKASDLSKVAISSKNNKLDWTRSGNTISVGVKDAFATDEPQAAIDELIITLGQFTRTVNIDYRPSVAQRFAKGLLVMNGAGGATIGAPAAPFKDVLIFKWSTIIGMRTCDNAGTPLVTAQVAYNPTSINVSSPQSITPYIPNTVTEAQYIGRDKDFLNYLHERTDLHNGGYGDPCREIGTVGGKKWRTPTASEWDELLSETPKAANGSPGKAIGFGGYVPRQTGTSSDAEFVNNAHYGWFYGPSAQQQTDAANPTKGSVFIYQRYYGTFNLTTNVGITALPTQNIVSSSASSTAGRFYYYTANDVGGYMGTQTIGDDKNMGNCFAVRCIQQ